MSAPGLNPNVSRCRGCGKLVVFAVDGQGRTQIVDLRPPVYRIFVQPDGRVTCERLEKDFHGVSHFATCPKADEFSRSKRPRAETAGAQAAELSGNEGREEERTDW